MEGHVIHFGPPAAAAAPDQVEPLEAAVLEVSARVEACCGEQRSLHSRMNELRTLCPSVRRKQPRRPAVVPSRPVTFYSIEEADAEQTSAPLQVA